MSGFVDLVSLVRAALDFGWLRPGPGLALQSDKELRVVINDWRGTMFVIIGTAAPAVLSAEQTAVWASNERREIFM